MSRPGPKPKPISVRFWRKVALPDAKGCWTWLGSPHYSGYGHFHMEGHYGRKVLAHRFAYEFLVGPIPEGLTLDHLCGNTMCVNPSHLEPTTSRENTLRGNSASGVNARKTHCLRGHPFDEANTYVTPAGHRRCRTCLRAVRARTRRSLIEKRKTEAIA